MMAFDTFALMHDKAACPLMLRGSAEQALSLLFANGRLVVLRLILV
jgi:hypothetical protein